jgi:hypothetical protein
MGLKSFLQQQGFIAEEPDGKTKEQQSASDTQPAVEPTFFPIPGTVKSKQTEQATAGAGTDPSFVAPLQQSNGSKEQPDPTFVKFFEDELVKANLAGPDYFEFRQQLAKTQQKMAARGVVAPDVVLQAVLTSFEAQDISTAKLIDAAKHYKQLIRQKNDDFHKGASAEKNNQLQKRQSVLQSHNDNIRKLQEQIQQLDAQKQQLEESMAREKSQIEIDRSLGKDGIEKIERAEKLIDSAHEYIQSTIDNDIKALQSV